MNNTIHVEVQIIELFAIGIGTSGVDWNFHSIDFSRRFFDDGAYNLGLKAIISCTKDENNGQKDLHISGSASGRGLRAILSAFAKI
jgi:hypothetical protein